MSIQTRTSVAAIWPRSIAELDGVVKFGEVWKGNRKDYLIGDDGEQREYAIPRGIHINVQEGERVRAGDPLVDPRKSSCVTNKMMLRGNIGPGPTEWIAGETERSRNIKAEKACLSVS